MICSVESLLNINCLMHTNIYIIYSSVEINFSWAIPNSQKIQFSINRRCQQSRRRSVGDSNSLNQLSRIAEKWYTHDIEFILMNVKDEDHITPKLTIFFFILLLWNTAHYKSPSISSSSTLVNFSGPFWFDSELWTVDGPQLILQPT